MKSNRLTCYYSDLYKRFKREISLRVIVVDSEGHLIFRRNRKVSNVYPISLAKYMMLYELFNLLSELEISLYTRYNQKNSIEIVSFDKRIMPVFININPNYDTRNINNVEELRAILDSHSNWSIRYDNKSRDVFQKLYTQSMINKEGKKLKGYKLPKKKAIIRKTKDALGDKCEKLVFFDVEMNCVDKKDNTLGYWEIVSIGVVKYNINTKSIDKFYKVIKPKVQTILSERCIQITGLNQEEIDKGVDFKECMLSLAKWLGHGKIVFLSWGREDIRALKSNSKLKGNENQLIFQMRNNYVDFQKEFSYYHEKMNQVVSLTKALESCNKKFEGNQHNALNDAYNLYRVYESYSNN